MIITINQHQFAVEDIYTLAQLVKIYPEQKALVFDLIISHQETFQKLIFDSKNVLKATIKRIISLFPQQKNIFLDRLLNHPTFAEIANFDPLGTFLMLKKIIF